MRAMVQDRSGTAEVLRRLGGEVTKRLYPNMGHTVNQDELDFVRGMMAALVISPSSRADTA